MAGLLTFLATILGMAVFSAFAVGIALLAGSTLSAQLAERKKQALTLAQGLGLAVRGTDELVGHYDGVPVRIYSRDHGGSSSTDWWTYTRCTLLEPLPRGMVVATQGVMDHLADLFRKEDIQLGNDLDPKLRITGRDEDEVRALLLDEQVTVWLRQIVHNGGRIELAKELSITRRGRHLDAAKERAEEAVALVKALAEAVRRPWRELGERLGLELDAELVLARGVVDGVRVEVEYADGNTLVNAFFEPGLPPGTLVAHDDVLKDGVQLGDRILDGMVRARSEELDVLRSRLCQDEVRGPLLEVVHGFRGSELREREVCLVAPGRLTTQLHRATAAVIDLARALQA